jgi:hypothetical protein
MVKRFMPRYQSNRLTIINDWFFHIFIDLLNNYKKYANMKAWVLKQKKLMNKH